MRFIYYLWENATQHHLNVLQKCKLGENETLGSHCGQTDRNVWRTNTPPLNAIVTNVVQFARWCTLHMFEKRRLNQMIFKQLYDVCCFFTWFITFLINQANAVSIMDKLSNGKRTRERSDHHSWLCLCLVLTWRLRLSLCADLKSHSLHL